MIDIEAKPFLRWAGSKRQIIGRLKIYWNNCYQRYVEPFAGSASLFFAIQPKRALLADLNAELIETYRVLRRYPGKLHRSLSRLPKSRATYNKFRSQNPCALSPFDRVMRFIYLNRFCFNGIYRTNQSGQFNVPYAPTGTGGVPSLDQFRLCANLLRKAELQAWDFGVTIQYVRKGDFVYIDPPYAVENRRIFREYGPRAFSKDDLERLAGYLERIHQRGAHFLVSYADCREARLCFQKWTMHRINVRRNVAGFSGDRKKTYELVITNIRKLTQQGDRHD